MSLECYIHDRAHPDNTLFFQLGVLEIHGYHEFYVIRWIPVCKKIKIKIHHIQVHALHMTIVKNSKQKANKNVN